MSDRPDPSPAPPVPTITGVPAGTVVLLLRNRQKDRPVSLRALRRMILELLAAMGLGAELGVQFVGAREMARVNEAFLGHEGSTDVITFDHGSSPERLHGECFISVADAVAQARDFGTSWDAEVVRYVIHAILHLRGFDDLEPAARRVMKRQENRWVRWAAARGMSIARPVAGDRSPPRRSGRADRAGQTGCVP